MRTELQWQLPDGRTVTRVSYFRPCRCGRKASMTLEMEKTEYWLDGQRMTPRELWEQELLGNETARPFRSRV